MKLRKQLSVARWFVIACSVLAVTLLTGTTTVGQRRPDGYALGDIPLDDATYQEYLKREPDRLTTDELPASYDARDEGIVTSPKNQGGCGSCWAFASVGALESHMLKTFGVGPENLSEQQQVSCNTSQSGCTGGSSDAPRYWESKGPLYEVCFPYTASDTTACGEAQCEKLRFRVVDWHTVQQSTAGFKSSLYTYGPSYWRYDVYSDFSNYWNNGNPGDVYVNGSGTTRQGGHAVLLIGWDDAKGAFLCKNSWGGGGPNNDGTFWIAYSGHAHNLRFGMSNFSLARYQSVCTWTGASSDRWQDGANWSCEEGTLTDGLATSSHAPGAGDDVVIPSSPAGGRWPTLSGGTLAVHDVTIEAGAQLHLADGALDVHGDWMEEDGAATSASGGTVALATWLGSPNQAITADGGSSFFDVRIGTGAGEAMVALASDVTIAGDLSILDGASLDAGGHTLRLAGDWLDSGNSFIPGSGAVVLEGDGQLVQKVASAYLLEREGFEGAFPPAGWSLATPVGDPWTQGPPGSDGGSDPHSGESFAWHKYQGTHNAWLVSPQISIPAGGATMTFWERNYWMSYYDDDGAHYVMASTGSCEPNDGAFIVLAEFDTGALSWTRRDLSLDAYAGQTICLAFNYRGAYSAEWYIDDVEVVTLVPGGDLAFYDLTISGAGAPPTFAGNLRVASNLSVAQGSTLDVSGLDLLVEGSLDNHGAVRETRDVGPGEDISFAHVGDGDGGFSYRGLGLKDTGGAGLGSTTVTVMGNQKCPPAQNLEDPIARCFEIEPSTPGEATLRFYYLTAELNGNDPGGLFVFHNVDGAWEGEPGTYTRESDGGDYDWVQVTGVDGYSPFTAADEDPTAVVVVDFSAAPSWDGVELAWETASEVSLLGFNLLRSRAPDGSYERINPELIPAERSGSAGGARYAWRDTDVSPGEVWYYELELVWKGGQQTSDGPVQATVPLASFLPLAVR